MRKIFLLVSAAALIAGIAVTGSAIAQNNGTDHSTLTANQIVAEADAHTARIKADLRLTPEQEKNWPGFETALHEISKSRADRRVASQAEGGQQKEQDDVIAYLTSYATFLSVHSADVKKLADAAKPLYASLDDQQKKRFARELISISRERGID
jgi:hypothetical protein